MLGLRVSHWFTSTPKDMGRQTSLTSLAPHPIDCPQKTQSSPQAGFTLVEVMLFLAITGLLFLIGFFGTGAQIRSVRFHDSMRGLHSYLQKQYGLVTTGSNPRQPSSTCTSTGGLGQPPTFGSGSATAGDTAGDAGDCVLLGRLMKFDPNTSKLSSYYVVGRRLDATQVTGDDITDLTNSGPTLSPQANEDYQVNWGASFYQPSTAPASGQTQSLAYLRSPSTGKIITFAFSNSAVGSGTVPGSDAGFRSAITTANIAKRAGYCFKDENGHEAIFKLGYDQRTDAVDLVFENFDPGNDCVRSKP